jgi:hemerythrin-like metal-binding protein
MPLTAKYKELITGIAEVDYEHFELIKLTVESIDLVATKQFKLAYMAMETLYDQFSYHCAMEEAMLKRYDYPYIDRHAKEHQRLKGIMLDSLATLLKNQADPIPKIAEIISKALHDVIIEHILKVDFHYVKFVKSCEAAN